MTESKQLTGMRLLWLGVGVIKSPLPLRLKYSMYLFKRIVNNKCFGKKTAIILFLVCFIVHPIHDPEWRGFRTRWTSSRSG